MYNQLITGRKSGIGPSGVPIMDTNNVAQNGIQIYTDVANSQDVWIGIAGMTGNQADRTDGFPLSSGDAIFLPIRHPSTVYVMSSGTNQKLWWILT